MYNDINIGPVTFHMYGIMIAIGVLVAYILCEYRAKKRELDVDIIFGILWCVMIGGVIGSRLLYYIVSIKEIMEDISIIWDFSTGFVVYGFIIGGVAASYIYCKIKKVSALKYFDLIMPEVALAQGIGRIGCFFAGCCYGRPTDSIFGIAFKHSEYAPNGVKLIPTQLISSAGDFVIAGVLFLYAKKDRADSGVGALYMILYGIGRFLVEFLRSDYRGNIGVMSTSQFISVIVVVTGIVIFIRANGKKTTVQQDM